MNQIVEAIFGLSRPKKRLISLVLDSFFIVLALLGAVVTKFESFDILLYREFWVFCAILTPLTILAFERLGLYREVLRYIGHHAAITVLLGVVISSVAKIFIGLYFELFVSASISVVYASFLLICVGGSRFALRSMVTYRKANRRKEKVLIYGAGSCGRQLAQCLMHGKEYEPIAFIDDDKSLQFNLVLGCKVIPPREIENLLDNNPSVSRVLLAMPSIGRSVRNKIISRLEPLPVKVMSIPGMSDLVDGGARIDELGEVALDDLLGRDPVVANPNLLRANIFDKVVMVTGAGGSIGSELCRQIAVQEPKAIILFEICEYALYQVEKELRKIIASTKLDIALHSIIGSVQDRTRIQSVMESFQVKTVYHAAAYKHVPIVEHNIVEGIRNNVFGTWYTAEAAISAGVDTFVLISTDKAVRPTNVMGASKRMAELVLQALNSRQGGTRFCMVRFGNVLGSSGSVVPLFREQIRNGGPVTVTHPEIVRYFMTIPEASQLVIQAGAMGNGGDVFVLDMGEQVQIADLARKMIRLTGLSIKDESNPDGDVAIKFTGLRPGEKLYEELLIGKDVKNTAHQRIMSANELTLSWNETKQLLRQLEKLCEEYQLDALRIALREAPLGYKPSDPITDTLWENGGMDRKVIKSKEKVVSLLAEASSKRA